MKNSLLLVMVVLVSMLPAKAQLITLLDFNGTNGHRPIASLIYDGTYLYGTAEQGGANDYGVVFKIKTDGSGYVDLFDFPGAPDGSHPECSLMSDGTYLYGMTNEGGINNSGTIFKIKTDGTGYVKLFDFTGTNGSYPRGSLIFDGTWLYGMTKLGGANLKGTLFKIKPDGTSYTDLLDFAGTVNGSQPYGDLLSDGTFLYGMTGSGGVNNSGTVFKIMPDGSSYFKLFDFTDTSANIPEGALISDGTFLYGMATFEGGSFGGGDIFRIKSDGTMFADLHDFSAAPDGNTPYGSLLMEGNTFYGLT